MARKFEVKYYEFTMNDKGEQYDKICVEEIKATMMELIDGMAVFYDNGSGKVIKAVYSNFVSVKEI